jgi:uncharacterized protein YbjT (DUF2867 family)
MILVTGGTGTVGSELIRILSERGATVRALVRDPGRAGGILRHGVETVRGDLSDPATLRAPLEGCDRVFLLSPPDPSQVAWQGNLIEAAKAAGTKPHVVKLSVIGAALDAPFRIGRWHAQTERHLEDSDLAWTFLRPGSFVQNFLHFAASIAGEGAFHQPAGDGRVAYVDARDVAEAAARVLLEGGHRYKAYELTGPEALTGEEVAERFSAAIGKPVRYVSVSPEAAANAMRGSRMPEWYIGMLLELFELQRNGASARITPTLRTLLGRPPRTVRAFARDYAAAFGG